MLKCRINLGVTGFRPPPGGAHAAQIVMSYKQQKSNETQRKQMLHTVLSNAATTGNSSIPHVPVVQAEKRRPPRRMKSCELSNGETASLYDNFSKTENYVMYDVIIWVQDGNCKKWLERIVVFVRSTI